MCTKAIGGFSYYFPMSTLGAQYRSVTHVEVTLFRPYKFSYDAVDRGRQNHEQIHSFSQSARVSTFFSQESTWRTVPHWLNVVVVCREPIYCYWLLVGSRRDVFYENRFLRSTVPAVMLLSVAHPQVTTEHPDSCPLAWFTSQRVQPSRCCSWLTVIPSSFT